MGHTVTTHTDGCRISPCQPPISNALLYGSDSLQTVRFPPVELIENERQRYVTRKLFGHLERGVLLRANREGIFIKRLCQSRVFWSGQDSQYNSGISKLERDSVVKIFDNNRFLHGETKDLSHLRHIYNQQSLFIYPHVCVDRGCVSLSTADVSE